MKKIIMLTALTLMLSTTLSNNSYAETQKQTSSLKIDGVYAGWFRFYFPEDPELYVDCYVYVDRFDSSIVTGVRFHAITEPYYGVLSGAANDVNATFTSGLYPGVIFSGSFYH